MPDDPSTDDVFFEEFAAQGQSFLDASGDAGAYDAGINPFFYPAEDVYVTAVGGTSLTTAGAGGPWTSEIAWTNSGGGISPDGITIPGWQSGVASSSNGGSATLRNIPDVAMEADFDNYVCDFGSCSGGWAGTSFAAPRWAGFAALINQQAVEAGTAPKGGVGFLNPPLYLLAEGNRYSDDLHDIVYGNNDAAGQPEWFSAVAGYDLVTGWGSANGQNLIDDLAGPQAPGFWLLGSPATVWVNPGGSNSTTLSVTDAGGFTGNVSLAVTSALPSGLTATWGANPTAGSSVLTLTASSVAPSSSTPLTITGTSGNLTSTTSVLAVVHPPSFVLSDVPGSLELGQGGSGSSTVTVVPQYGFTGAVSLSVSGLPSGVTASFSPISTTGSSTLTVTASSTATLGTTTLTITGTSGNLTATATLALTINAPSFTLNNSGPVNIGQGSSGTTYIYVNSEYGFAGSVNLSVSGLPAGVTASFSPNPAPSGFSTLTLTASSNSPAGTSTLTVTGTSGNVTATTTLSLVIHQPTFTLSSGGTIDIGQGKSGSTYIFLTPQYGFTGTVNLTVSGLPTGVTASFAPNNPIASGISVLTLTASSSASLGVTTLTITGASGGQTATTTLALGIFVPTFTLSSGGTLNMGQGTSSDTYVYVNPEYGFNGNVTLSVSGLPTGVGALWNPNPTTGSADLTLTVSGSAPIGISTLTITGKSGSITATTTLTLGIYAPTFTLSSVGNADIGQGTSGTWNVEVFPEYGFTGSVALSVSGLPSGVTASFNPNPTTGFSTMTLTASNTAPIGTSTLTITGKSGAQTATSTLTLGVHTPTFTIYGTGGLSLGQGTSSTTYVYVSSEYGFNGNVNFSVSGLPAGVTGAFSPNPTTSGSTLTLTASTTAPLGQYTLTITGTSGGQTATMTIPLAIYVPTFTLYAYGGNVGQGTSSSNPVYVNDLYGFNANVALSISGLPSGVTAVFSPNPTTNSSELTLTTSATAPVGQYTLTITGTSGAQTVTTTVPLGIYAPTFTISGPGSMGISQGATTTAYASVYAQYGFTGSVNFSISGLPTGVTASFSPNPTTSNSTLTLTASSSAVPGQYTLTITGTSAGLTATTPFTLQINPTSFTLSSSPASLTMNEGASASANIYVNPQFGFTGSVNFAVSDLPSGVTATLSPNPSTSTSTLTVTASNAAAPGTTIVTITGTSGNLTAVTTLYITVDAPSFTLINAPGEVNLAPGSSGESTIAVVPQNGFSGNVSLAATGLPSGVSAAFSPNPMGAGTSVMTLTASSTASTGSTTVTITGTSGSLTATTSVVVSTQTAPATTSTTLQITAGGNPVTSIARGKVVTLTAAVSAGATALTTGQVNFCDATATYCDPMHLRGIAQLTSAGTAVLRFVPGMGRHSYKAVFAGTNGDSTSSSEASNLTVTAAQPTTTTIARSGNFGDYTLTASVTGQGPAAPGGTVSFLDTTSGNSVVGTAALANGPPALSWGNPESAAIGTQPYSIAVADFNGDGIPDLAIAFTSNKTLTILLGNGDGTFNEAAINTQSGPYPSFVAAGDFNHDGKADLAVTNPGTNDVMIFLGNGDATFTAVATSPETGSEPGVIGVGDFNGDGIQDLAIVNNGSGTVTVLLGNGDGTFTASPLSAQTDPNSTSIAVGDFNGDGILDLAIGSDYMVTMLLGNGDGSFTPAPSPVTGDSPYGAEVAAGDFNQDGKLDLAAVIDGTVTILLGNGDGTFSATTTGSTLVNGPTPIAVGDFNADGKPDLAVLNQFDDVVTILLGNGDGTFTATATNPSAGFSPYALAVADFNGDGTSDLAVTNGGFGTTFSILTSQLTQTATATVTGISATGTGSQLVDASYPGDSNYKASVSATTALNTGLVTPTVTVAPSSSSITTAQSDQVTVTVSGGSGNPAPTGSVMLSSGAYTSVAKTLAAGSATINVPAGSLAVGNDTLTASYTPDAGGSATYNGATGTASVMVTQAIESCTTANPNPNPNPASFAAVADFNGDCKSDILWRNASTQQVYEWFMNGTTYTSSGSPGSPTSDWVIQGTGDFNGDGKSDILWRNNTTGEVYIWIMNGSTFTSSGSLGYVSSDWSIAGLGDFKGDGKADILWQNSSTGQVYVWFINGTTMTGGGSVTYVSSNWAIQSVGDFNGDGMADILWRNSTTGEVYIWLMNGSTLTTSGSLGYVSSDWGIQGVGDFNGDGKSDILWRNSTTGQIYLWLINGTAMSGGGSVTYVSSDWVIQGVADYDGSGRAGILWRNSTTQQVYVWLMNGATLTSSGSPGAPDATWQIAP
jgi:uncharacterized membrane protein